MTALSQLALSTLGLSEFCPTLNCISSLPLFLFFKQIEDINKTKRKQERNTFMHIQFICLYTFIAWTNGKYFRKSSPPPPPHHLSPQQQQHPLRLELCRYYKPKHIVSQYLPFLQMLILFRSQLLCTVSASVDKTRT